MKKILITNNSQFVSEDYDIIYTDSPYVIEHHSRAIYLDTLLEKELSNKVKDICKKGSLLNKELIESFFPKYQNRDIELIDIIKIVIAFCKYKREVVLEILNRANLLIYFFSFSIY